MWQPHDESRFTWSGGLWAALYGLAAGMVAGGFDIGYAGSLTYGPQLLVLIVTAFALSYVGHEGYFAALGVGFCADVLEGTPFGVHMMGYLALVPLVRALFKDLPIFRPVLEGFITTIAGISFHLLYLILAPTLGSKVGGPTFPTWEHLYSAPANFLFGMVIAFVVLITREHQRRGKSRLYRTAAF